MNIVRFIYDWPRPWMGLAPGPYEMTRTQAAMGHSLTVLCGKGGRGSRVPEPIPGVRILALPRAVKGILLFTSAPALLARMLLLGGKPDVIHGHAHVGQWYALWRLLFGGRTPYFHHLHITFAGREEALRAKGHRFTAIERFANRAGRLADVWSCRAATHIFATNESVKSEAVRLASVPADKITVVRNGVNTSLFRPLPKAPDLLRQLDVPEGAKVVLYVGVLNARKNLLVLVEALAALSAEYHLVLAGGGAEEYAASLAARAAALGLASRVHRAGYVDYPDLPPYYALADVFALPSLYEGLPKALLEALACGKPAVIHRGYALDAGLDPFVDKADCTSPKDLAGAVHAAGERGFKGDLAAYAAEFSWRAIMEKVEQAYLRFK